MAEFYLKETPTYGGCLTCGTSACPGGFIDMVSEVDITRGDHRLIGNVDVVICADCLDQAARTIGCLTRKDSEKLLFENREADTLILKLQDEASSWQQRYENLVEIMSMVQLQGASSSDSFVGGADTSPNPDLRVQEGRELASKGAGKATKHSKS